MKKLGLPLKTPSAAGTQNYTILLHDNFNQPSMFAGNSSSLSRQDDEKDLNGKKIDDFVIEP